MQISKEFEEAIAETEAQFGTIKSEFSALCDCLKKLHGITKTTDEETFVMGFLLDQTKTLEKALDTMAELTLKS